MIQALEIFVIWFFLAMAVALEIGHLIQINERRNHVE